MPRIYPQAVDKQGRGLWKFQVNGKWHISPEVPEGATGRIFTVKDRERIEQGVKTRKAKDPYAKLSNAYLQRLEGKRKAIVQAAKARGIAPEEIAALLLDYLNGDKQCRFTVDQKMLLLRSLKNRYVALTFGEYEKTAEHQYWPRPIAQYVKYDRLDLWAENIRDGALDQGCYTFILSADLLWGLCMCEMKTLGRIADIVRVGKEINNVVALEEAGPATEF